MNSIAATTIIRTSPRKASAKPPSRISASTASSRKKTANSGSSLPSKRDQRAAAGAAQPGAQAAPRELGADRIAGGDRDDDVEHGRHHRAQQKPGVVERGVGQHVLLDDERAAADRLQPNLVQRRQAGEVAAEIALAQAARGDVARREVLLVVEGDDLRPAPGHQIPLEFAAGYRRRRWRARSGSPAVAAVRLSARWATRRPGAAAIA